MHPLRDSRASIMLLVVASVAFVSVTALSLQTWAAWEQQRLTESRMRDDVARIAARNTVSRVQGVAATELATLLDPMQRPSLGTPALVTRARELNDSLARGVFASRLRFRRIRLYDGTGRPLDEVTGPPVDAPSAPQLQRSLGTDEPRLFARRDGSLLALTRLARRTTASPVIAVVSSQPNDLSERLVPYVLDSLGIMVPAVLTGRTENRSVFTLIVRNGADTLFRSGAISDAIHAQSWPFGADSSLIFSAQTNRTLAIPSVGNTTERSSVIGLAIATMLAVVASTALAWRSAQVARMRGDFAAAVSHELRTPLTEIILFAELLESGRTSDAAEVRDAARLIMTEARRLHHMVDNVLHVTSIDAHAFPMNVKRQPVRALAEDVLTAFRPIAAQRECTVTLACPDDPSMSIDASAFRQVLLNLLDNAVRYGPDAQQIAVRISAGHEFGTIEVDDEGPGIPRAERGRVLEPYVRLPRDVSRARTGTGLGLSVVAALVDQMHGRLRLDESSRGGTLVVVTLPAT